MLNRIRSLFTPAAQPEAARKARVPEGERYYVIGDIHGRLDLYEALIEAIEADEASLPAVATTVVLLGDLVDRGPDSAGVIARTMEWATRRRVRCLAGNHEEMFLDSFEDIHLLRHFIRHGGRETILSYGLDRKTYNKLDLGELQAAMHRVVPAEHRSFLEACEDLIVAGDYVFVHAGIDPARSLDEQETGDLRWIRDRFLRHAEPHSHVVVHGHTIFEEVDHSDHRIGIDTGAFRTGRLTALVLEEDRRHFLQAVETDGTIALERIGA